MLSGKSEDDLKHDMLEFLECHNPDKYVKRMRNESFDEKKLLESMFEVLV